MSRFRSSSRFHHVHRRRNHPSVTTVTIASQDSASMKPWLLLVTLVQGYLILDNVFINGSGPHRFLVDTGSQSTSMDESIARKLSIVPTHRVWLDTPSGSQLVLGGTAASISVGESAASKIEVLWYDLRNFVNISENVDGILGQNFLSVFDYVLDFRNNAVHFAAPSSMQAQFRGERIPFRLK